MGSENLRTMKTVSRELNPGHAALRMRRRGSHSSGMQRKTGGSSLRLIRKKALQENAPFRTSGTRVGKGKPSEEIREGFFFAGPYGGLREEKENPLDENWLGDRADREKRTRWSRVASFGKRGTFKKRRKKQRKCKELFQKLRGNSGPKPSKKKIRGFLRGRKPLTKRGDQEVGMPHPAP